MKRSISTILFIIVCVTSLFMMGCGSSPLSNNDANENDVTDNSPATRNPYFMRMVITDIPYNDNDNPETFRYAFETSYTHWYGRRYGLKILETTNGPRFYHAPDCDWNRAFYSDRIDYKSDIGRQYSATLESHAMFRHTRRNSNQSHVSDRIHFIDKNFKKICVRLQQQFGIRGAKGALDLKYELYYDGHENFEHWYALLIGEKFYVQPLLGEWSTWNTIAFRNHQNVNKVASVEGYDWHVHNDPYNVAWLKYTAHGYKYEALIMH